MSTKARRVMTPTRQMTTGIMLALVAWGVYLAIGATGMFIQEDMMDARKSGIVIACVALFLGLWSIVLFSQRKPAESAASADSSSSASQRSLSKAGMTTLGLLLTGVASWLVGIGTWQQLSLAATTALGWIAAFCFTAAATAGIIALSSKTADRGKWIGLLGLAGFASAFVVFVIRMTP